MNISYVLCEGLHDRAFWLGWLKHLGCRNEPRGPSGSLSDRWGRELERDACRLTTSGGDQIYLLPCNGDANVVRRAHRLLSGLPTHPFDALLLNIDDDRPPGETQDRAEGMLRQVTGCAAPPWQQGQTRVDCVVWRSAAAARTELPASQTLERILCAALDAATPGSGDSVRRWLMDAPAGPAPGPKAWFRSHLIKWYPSTSDPYGIERLWEQPGIAAALAEDLSATGATDTVRRLLGLPPATPPTAPR